MPGPADPPPADLTGLNDKLTALVTAVDGVDRLHPTLRRAVATVAAGVLHPAAPWSGRPGRPGQPGLDLSRHDNQIDVVADLGTTADHRAVTVCRAVRQTIQDTLHDAGYRPGTITITVVNVAEPHQTTH